MNERASRMPDPTGPIGPERVAPRRQWQPEQALSEQASVPPQEPEDDLRSPRVSQADADATSALGSTPDRSESPPDTTEPPPPPGEPESGVPASRRPSRPPVQLETAAVVAATRPGRIQVASERIWATAILLGAVGLITAWIAHDAAVLELLPKVPAGGTEAERRDAAALLHGIALGLTGLGLVPEIILVAFLRRRRVVVRVLLSLLAVMSVVLLAINLQILTVPGWRGTVIAVTLAAHGVLAVVGSVLMWLPVGRPTSP